MALPITCNLKKQILRKGNRSFVDINWANFWMYWEGRQIRQYQGKIIKSNVNQITGKVN